MNDFDNLNNRPDDEQQNGINEPADNQGFEEKSAQPTNENPADNTQQYRDDRQSNVNQGNFTQNTNYYPYGNGQQNNQLNYNYNPNNQNIPPYNYQRPNQPDNQYNGYYSNPYPYANQQKQYAYPEDNFNSDNGKKKNGKKIFFAVVAVVCILAISGVVLSLFNGDFNPPAADDTNVPIENVDELETNATPSDSGETAADGTLRPKDIYTKVLESSVGILVYDSRSSVVSEGSGVVFSEDTDKEYTYIITCAHVISDTGVSLIVLWLFAQY